MWSARCGRAERGLYSDSEWNPPKLDRQFEVGDRARRLPDGPVSRALGLKRSLILRRGDDVIIPAIRLAYLAPVCRRGRRQVNLLMEENL